MSIVEQKRKLHRRLEIIGAIAVCICATPLHFVYEWSGGNFIVGLFSATNESVWEHTKLIYFPMLAYAVLEYFVLKPDFKRFLAAKAVALAFGSLAMISFYYTYTGALGIESLILDILCTFAWAALGFVISYKLYYSHYRLERYFPMFCALLVGQLAAQILFTPFAPGLPLFEDQGGL